MSTTAAPLTRQQEVKIELDEAKNRYRELGEQMAQCRLEIDALVVEGDKLGIPKLTMSQISGLTRQTIYGILLRYAARR